ncbi:retrotransposon protein [Cucumis melo var. makuwa]|uniref:Retrotransposon protein n=1 Tax=Cucumis melo var. makuwa TaxID=1194695 RepID=A0A5A7VDR4_CUCMM|nr:retrotransposon protein [Cucumis melo var. makuwa]
MCASFGSTRLMCASFGSTRLICASSGSTRLICAFYGTTRLLSRVRAQRGADRREAGRTREGHMDASGEGKGRGKLASDREGSVTCHMGTQFCFRIYSTRMDKRTFAILCHLLRNVAGLSSTEIVDVEEMVAMFLHVLAHDVKNRIIQWEFVRSDETVSRHFNIVLLAVVRLYEKLIKRPVPNCLGALDGTYIKVNVPAGDRPTFRTRKGEIATNVLGVCDTKGDFVYGFLVPYRGQRYHLQEWRGVANAPTNLKEYFNMKHSSARNVIERAFGVLKGRWTILRGKSYYPQQVQCRTILACALLQNLINREMTYCEDVNDVDEGDSTYATTTASEDIHYIETTNEWSQWHDELVKSMFTDWQLRNA